VKILAKDEAVALSLGPEVFTEILRPSFRPEELGDQVWTETSVPADLLLVAWDDAEHRVLGCAVGDLFPRSETLLLSYLAVRPGLRSGGIGSALMQAVQDEWCTAHPFAVAELDDPRRHEADEEHGDPEARLRFYNRFGMKAIAAPYFQPRLATSLPRAYHMILGKLASPGEDDEQTADGKRLHEFLVEYFTDCEGEAALDDPEVQWLLAFYEKDDLDLVPVTEVDCVPDPPSEPALQFTQFGVSLHFVAPTPNNGQPAAHPEKNPFASFEEDLLSYRFVPHRYEGEIAFRFENHLVALPSVDGKPIDQVDLVMPSAFRYWSEGARQWFVFPGREGTERRRSVAVKASRSDFKESRLSVFHLTFGHLADDGSGGPESWLDEYDTVALSKSWQGGEYPEPEGGICMVEVPGRRESVSIAAFAREVFRPDAKVDAEWHVRCGTIELLTDYARQDIDLSSIWDRAGDEAKDDALSEQVVALGGIIQGLLDFRAIDTAELGDVFDQVRREDHDATELLGIHKGTILYAIESDRSFESAAPTIGISPYVLLPQAVLLHNEGVLDHAKDLLRQAAKEEAAKKKPPRDVDHIRKATAWCVPNVFHYPQERELYDKGVEARLLTERVKEVEEETNLAEDRWKTFSETRRVEADRTRNILLAVIGSIATAHYFSETWERVLIVALYTAGLLFLDHRSYGWTWPTRMRQRLSSARHRNTGKPAQPPMP
jgi:GNAT superfamily N-acetyltransferase